MRLKVAMPPMVNDGEHLKILEAHYGALGVTNDVRSYVEANIQNDMVTMTIANGTLGGDPFVGYVKSLYIWYQNSTGQYEAKIGENQVLQIPDATHTKTQ